MSHIRVPIRSWDRFLTRHLTVAPEVLGRAHVFAHGGSEVRMRILGIEMVDRTNEFDPVASAGTYYMPSGRYETYHIHKVDVTSSISATRVLPKEILMKPPKAHDLLSGEEQKDLNDLAQQYRSLAIQAFEYWLRIVRWITDDHRIGRPEVNKSDSGWRTYLVEAESSSMIWASSAILVVPAVHTLHLEEWESVQREMDAHNEVPVHILLNHDAHYSLDNDDYASSLLFSAMACEIYMRSTVARHLPSSLNPRMAEYLDSASVAQYYNHFFPDILDPPSARKFKSTKSSVSKLFDRCNKLVHSGNTDMGTRDTCVAAIETTRDVFSLRLAVPQA